VLFNDGDDNEQATAYIAAIQIREGAMTPEEVAALGGPSAAGIPLEGEIPDPDRPSLSVSRQGANLVISWVGTGFTLESTENLATPNWTPVTGVTGNSATIPPTDNARFYRLRAN